MGLESEWQADITLGGTTLAPRVTGEIDLVRGTLDFAGRSFDLEEGKVTFPTGDAYDPSIQLLATDTIETVTVNVNVSGRAIDRKRVVSGKGVSVSGDLGGRRK